MRTDSQSCFAHKIGSLIRFLLARNVSVGDIHQEMRKVYGPIATSDSKLHKWMRAVKDGLKNVHYELRSGRPSVSTQDDCTAVGEKICEDQRFTISTLTLEFPNLGRTILYKIVSENLHLEFCCCKTMPDPILPSPTKI